MTVLTVQERATDRPTRYQAYFTRSEEGKASARLRSPHLGTVGNVSLCRDVNTERKHTRERPTDKSRDYRDGK